MSTKNQIYMNSSSIRTAGSKCNLILQKCLAIQLHKTRGVIPCGPNNTGRNGDGGVGVGVGGGVGGAVDDYWMYDNGYLLFQVRIPPSFVRLRSTFSPMITLNVPLFSSLPTGFFGSEFKMFLEFITSRSHERTTVRRLRFPRDPTGTRESLRIGNIKKRMVKKRIESSNKLHHISTW